MFKKLEMPWIKATRLKAETRAKEERIALQRKQDEIGQKLTRILYIAAAKNTISNIFANGEKSSIGPITITECSHNGGNFTIWPVMADNTVCCTMPLGGRGHVVYQIDINLSNTGKELHFFQCPYGPDDFNWDISRLKEFTEFMANKVKTYTIFPR